MYDHANFEQFTVFVERFEARVAEYDTKFEQVLRGEDPFVVRGAAGSASEGKRQF